MKRTVTGQLVTNAKFDRAREMRSHPTPEERILWRELRANRLAGLHFRRQQIVAGFIVDFYCHAAALVVEVDWAAHNNRASYDAARDNILHARGLRVLRLTASDVRDDLSSTLARIAHAASLPAPEDNEPPGDLP